MFMDLERQLVSKNYIEYDNKNLLSYRKKNDPMSQIDIEYVGNRYKFTFPLESGEHYTSYTKEKEQVEKYANYIISTYIK